jgi:hypothetical protein
VLQEVQRIFCVDSNSEKLDPKLPFGQPSHASGLPSMSRSFELFKVAPVRTSQQHVRTLISGQQEIGFPSHNTDMGRQLHPSGRHGNTVRTPVLIMEIMCSRSATIWTLGQQRPDAALLWYCMKRIMESRLHNCPSRQSQLASGRHLEKSKTNSI